MRCLGYIINLAVNAFLFQNVLEIEELELYNDQEGKGELRDNEERKAKFQLMGPLGQLHNIIVYICGSTSCINEFLELAGRMVPLDNRTRWNSWHIMLYVALEKALAIDTYAKAYNLELDYLSLRDWKRLCTI
jgi:hypothetical protein